MDIDGNSMNCYINQNKHTITTRLKHKQNKFDCIVWYNNKSNSFYGEKLGIVCQIAVVQLLF